jgi:hypothetical protein
MPRSTIQFISHVKLEEFRRQRAVLLEAYDQLRAECHGQVPQEALRRLYRGLGRIKIGHKPLHPDLGNLDLLVESVAPSPDIVAFWRRRLETEWGMGRLRADIVYVFGALLGEWGGEDPAKREFLDERQQVHRALLRDAVTPSPANEHRQLLEELFAGFGERRRELPARVSDSMAGLYRNAGHVVDHLDLDGIAKNQYLPPAVRREAKRFTEDAVLTMQFMDALRVETRDMVTWDWPRDGMGSRALWTRNKWRLYLNQTLVEISLAHCFGAFWASTLENSFSDGVLKINRLSRLAKLLEMKAPPVIIENEERMLRQQEDKIDLGWYEPTDPWDGTPVIPPDRKVAGIVAVRAELQRRLRHDSRGYYAYGANAMVHLVHAEVQTLRAAFPDKPLFIAKLDLRDYFASIPHDVLLTMVRAFGLGDREAEAIQRFLEVPYLIDDKVTKARCGVPMAQELSHWLAEWLLRLMERYVHERARVRIIRQIDDICLLSPSGEQLVAAWNAVRAFIHACSLSINDDKCGTLAIGGELLGDLPPSHPRWGFLELNAAWEWHVHEPTLQTFIDDTRKHVWAKQAVLSKVTLYNAHLRFLTSALGLALDLGPAHRRAINDAMHRFEADFFGPGVGIVGGLQQEIQQRYLHGTQITNLPESWMYWPITAGGLSLRCSLVLCGQYQVAYEARQKNPVTAPVTRPANWQLGDSKWSAFYGHLLAKLEPAKPTESPVMKTLVDDFIARGKEISAGKQTSLSDYWRWILGIYGPEILDRFGTFRFLLTDLVPLQLIHEQLLHESSLDGA